MKIDSFLREYGQLLSIPRHSYVFRQGESDTDLYFLREGVLKASYLTEDGKEFIKSFLLPGDFISSLTASYLKESCSFDLYALENSQVMRVGFDKLYELAFTDQGIMRFFVDRLLALAMKKERREYEFLCCSPGERYELLRKRNPEILNRITQNDIARYLGITPVALSRIRGRANK